MLDAGLYPRHAHACLDALLTEGAIALDAKLDAMAVDDVGRLLADVERLHRIVGMAWKSRAERESWLLRFTAPKGARP